MGECRYRGRRVRGCWSPGGRGCWFRGRKSFAYQGFNGGGNVGRWNCRGRGDGLATPDITGRKSGLPKIRRNGIREPPRNQDVGTCYSDRTSDNRQRGGTKAPTVLIPWFIAEMWKTAVAGCSRRGMMGRGQYPKTEGNLLRWRPAGTAISTETERASRDHMHTVNKAPGVGPGTRAELGSENGAGGRGVRPPAGVLPKWSNALEAGVHCQIPHKFGHGKAGRGLKGFFPVSGFRQGRQRPCPAAAEGLAYVPVCPHSPPLHTDTSSMNRTVGIAGAAGVAGMADMAGVAGASRIILTRRFDLNRLFQEKTYLAA